MAVTVRLQGIEKAIKDINKYLVDYKGETDKVFFEFYAKVRQDAIDCYTDSAQRTLAI